MTGIWHLAFKELCLNLWIWKWQSRYVCCYNSGGCVKVLHQNWEEVLGHLMFWSTRVTSSSLTWCLIQVGAIRSMKGHQMSGRTISCLWGPTLSILELCLLPLKTVVSKSVIELLPQFIVPLLVNFITWILKTQKQLTLQALCDCEHLVPYLPS